MSQPLSSRDLFKGRSLQLGAEALSVVRWSSQSLLQKQRSLGPRARIADVRKPEPEPSAPMEAQRNDIRQLSLSGPGRQAVATRDCITKPRTGNLEQNRRPSYPSIHDPYLGLHAQLASPRREPIQQGAIWRTTVMAKIIKRMQNTAVLAVFNTWRAIAAHSTAQTQPCNRLDGHAVNGNANGMLDVNGGVVMRAAAPGQGPTDCADKDSDRVRGRDQEGIREESAQARDRDQARHRVQLSPASPTSASTLVPELRLKASTLGAHSPGGRLSAASTLSQRRPCSGISSCNSSGPTSPLSPLALRDATAKMAKLSMRHAYRADYAGLCAECRRNLSTLSASPHHDPAIAHGTTAPSTAATRVIRTATCSGPRCSRCMFLRESGHEGEPVVGLDAGKAQDRDRVGTAALLQQISRQIAMQHAELLELKAAMQTLTSLHGGPQEAFSRMRRPDVEKLQRGHVTGRHI